jgi:hypothetical protein
MHEPAACGVLPAQHSSVHMEPADTRASGAMLDRNATASITASASFGVFIILNRVECRRSICRVEERWILPRETFMRKAYRMSAV